MTIYSFYLFDRHCECIYSKIWHATPGLVSKRLSGQSTSEFARTKTVASTTTAADNAKLIFGVVFSLRNMVRKLTGEDSFLSYKTSKYRLHYYETASNIRFVMVTDLKSENMHAILHQIYVSLYVEYVVKNPLSPVEHPNGEGVNNELFVLGLDAFVASLPGFS